ncbi:MAG: extracellular solute-binding protein [Chitinispirillaceae bacterium]|nr:extracellular solute-binding protein [Chitinispirillaceae bacterium]
MKLSALAAFVIIAVLAGCTPVREMKALITMMDDQEKYFRTQVIPPFEKLNHAKIEVIHYDNADSLASYLARYKGSVGLVKVPFDLRTTLHQQRTFIPLDVFLKPEEIAQFKSDYLLTNLGAYEDRPCLIPRKFETRIMVYSKSKVAAAVAAWRPYKLEIDAEMKQYNGFGLPADFFLETNPSEWDYYDFFVVGWIWAHTPYDGKASGRIGLRGKRYSGTWLGIVDRIYQLGGDSAAVMDIAGDAVVDAMHWEAVYAASGVYNANMWEKGWSGADIWQAFADGEVFLSFMTQLDCFFLHGTGRDNLEGYFRNPRDMGFALMPRACSVVLNAENVPVRQGKRSVTTGGWWWGIPATAPDPQTAFKLASHITSTGSQIQECTRFGMIPVRKDVLSDMTMMFGGTWITEVYNVSFQQLMENGYTTLPGDHRLGNIGLVYLDAWYEMVAGKNWSADKTKPDRAYLAQRLATEYAPRAAVVLRNR